MKLGVRDRTRAVLRALDRGLLGEPGVILMPDASSCGPSTGSGAAQGYALGPDDDVPGRDREGQVLPPLDRAVWRRTAAS